MIKKKKKSVTEGFTEAGIEVKRPVRKLSQLVWGRNGLCTNSHKNKIK